MKFHALRTADHFKTLFFYRNGRCTKQSVIDQLNANAKPPRPHKCPAPNANAETQKRYRRGCEAIGGRMSDFLTTYIVSPSVVVGVVFYGYMHHREILCLRIRINQTFQLFMKEFRIGSNVEILKDRIGINTLSAGGSLGVAGKHVGLYMSKWWRWHAVLGRKSFRAFAFPDRSFTSPHRFGTGRREAAPPRLRFSLLHAEGLAHQRDGARQGPPAVAAELARIAL